MSKLRPRDAKTFNQQCLLQTDGHGTKDYWILIDCGKVYIHAQRVSESTTQRIAIRRGDFNRLVDWYNREQKLRKPIRLSPTQAKKGRKG